MPPRRVTLDEMVRAAPVVTLACAAALSCSLGCGSSSRADAGADSGPASVPLGPGGGPCACNLPPSPPQAGATGGRPHDYALRTLYLGDTDRDGSPSATAWESYGYNLDGLLTTPTSTDVCTLVAGASAQVQQDGDEGIDNSFGENLVPILQQTSSASPTPGNFPVPLYTVMAWVVGFDDSAGNTTSAIGLSGALLSGADYEMWRDGGPGWDLTTSWPVLASSLTCPAAGCAPGTNPLVAARVQFSAFQTKGTFVEETPGPLSLTLSIAGQPVAFPIEVTVVSFDPLQPGAVTNGILAGAIDTAQLVSSFRNLAGDVSTSLCMGTAFQAIALQIEQTSDIVLTGATVSNGPGRACNAISIGLGFDATEIAPPSQVVPDPDAGPGCGP